MYKIGACAGKFRIIHQGHLEYFMQAAMLCDEVHVFFVTNPNVKRYLDEEKTIIVLKEIFENLDVKYYIHITDFKEGEVWDQYLIDTIGTKDFIIFNSKEDYENTLVKNRYLECQSEHSISATNIEENIYEFENFNNIEQTFSSYLTQYIGLSNSNDFERLKTMLELLYKNRRFSFKCDNPECNLSIDLKHCNNIYDEYKYCINTINSFFDIRR